jgi:hypothetical protein
MTYPDGMKLLEARRLYFDANGFGEDGGYSKRWFKVGWKWLALPLPNTASRVRAVRVHDLHHIATGYPTTWRGEAEIGAWELAGGCGDYGPAWLLNRYSFAVGLVIAPKRLWRAFLSGRHCKNLYSGEVSEDLLQEPVGHLRRRLGLSDDVPEPAFADVRAFGATALASAFQAFVTAVPLLAAAVALVFGFRVRPKSRRRSSAA